ATLGALEELLVSWPGCALIVSHDRYFLDRVATSTLAFEGDGVVQRYPGGYGTYRSLRRQAEADAALVRAGVNAGRSATQKSTSPPAGPRASGGTASHSAGPETTTAKPLSSAEKKELDGLLDVISGLEERVRNLEVRVASPEIYVGDPALARSVRAEHAEAQSDLVARTARWEELEARRDAKAVRPGRS
ncbi:MAG TPA: hypothetical protein VF395_14065, partial [Polyangiaceae bacterium]